MRTKSGYSSIAKKVDNNKNANFCIEDRRNCHLASHWTRAVTRAQSQFVSSLLRG